MSKRCMGCMGLFGDEFEICPHCGYAVGTHAEEAIHMEPGTLLHDRYIVGKVLGFGGFGVTYIAWDGKLEQKVAIKEYLPGEFSTRMPGQTLVTVFNGDKSEQFADGMKKFVDEAKRLAKFQNQAGIVKVFDSFEENSTAYIIMEYLDGETLTDYLKRVGTIPAEQAVEMLMPIMESLEIVHESGLLHRDIAPDNIFLTKTGEVKLIDFGASRYATTSHSRSLTVIIKPGYSPEEQYRSRGDQGPYTDVYAIAATLYKMITGKTPPDAMERRAKYENENKDILQEPHKITKKIPAAQEIAILNGMNVRIEDRTQTVGELIKELHADPPAKRRYGKIKKIDVYHWPLWLKILIPTTLAVILVFTGLLVTGVISFSNYSEKIVIPDNMVVVPDVEGANSKDAIALIESGQLLAKTGGTVESEYIEAGKIILQTPVGGSYMELNSSIMLTVSSGKGVQAAVNGKSIVPYVIWDTKEDAISKFAQAGLGEPIIEEVYDENVEFGHVISQSIEPLTEVDEGTVVTLKISLGAEAFELPDVTGMKQEDAQKKLLALGLTVSGSYEKSTEVEPGCVISQDIEPGTLVKRGDEIAIAIAVDDETIAVENVIGKTKADAVKVLEGQGFKVKVLENYDTDATTGKVINQSPKGGSEQLAKAEITIVVSKGAKPNSGGTAATVTTKAPTTQTVVTTTAPAKRVTVTFNANGGTVSLTSKTVTVGEKYGTLPSPTKKGWMFAGWYTSSVNGSLVSSSSVVSNSSAHTLYAHWSAKSYTVTLDYGYSGKTGTTTVYGGENYNVPTNVTRDYYTFLGWYDASGRQITNNTAFSADENVTIYAKWQEKSQVNWVDYSSVPTGAKIVDEKWTYTKTTDNSHWQLTGTGTHYYASFPSGFNTGDGLYSKYNKGALSSSSSSTARRDVSSASRCSYIYWHWTHDIRDGSVDNRYVQDYKGGAFTIFYAVEDSADYEFSSAAGNVWKHNFGRGTISYWWFRLNIYKQTYSDYKWVEDKTTTNHESTTAVTAGGEISNVKHLVCYIPK